MASIVVDLKRIGPHEFAIFGPKGNQLSEVFRGGKYDAIEWGTRWIGSWPNWVLNITEIMNESEGPISI